MNCPECAAPALYNWVLRHTNNCTIRDAEDATQAADRERLKSTRGVWPFAGVTFKRPTTATERVLLVASGHTPSDEALTVVTWQGYRHRVIDGLDAAPSLPQ